MIWYPSAIRLNRKDLLILILMSSSVLALYLISWLAELLFKNETFTKWNVPDYDLGQVLAARCRKHLNMSPDSRAQSTNTKIPF